MGGNPEGGKNEGWRKWFEPKLRELTDWFTSGIRRYFTYLIIIAAGVYDGWLFVRATQRGSYFLSQATVLAGVVLVFLGVARLTNSFSLARSEEIDLKLENDKKRSDWLVRLALLAALGLSGIILYAIQYEHWNSARVASVASVGAMAAGAAWLVGALLGFLFGIPHTRSTGAESSKQGGGAGQKQADDTTPARQGDNSYAPSTSLEQISDWLTKIIVGVGLTQLSKIPPKLDGLAAYISNGMCGDQSSKAFALSIIVYFSVCGFLFGYLWARLYMIEAFRAADEVQVLEEKISRLESQPKADATALSLINGLLNRQPTDPPVTEEVVASTIKAASVPVKIQIFNQAEKAVDTNWDADDFDAKMEGAISMLKGLIASDLKQRYHRNYSELSYALKNKKPPDWVGALDAINKAIKIRDDLGKSGWRHYEFQRARCRIEQLPNIPGQKMADAVLAEQILGDLRASYKGTEESKWLKWQSTAPRVSAWMQANGITTATLGQA